MKRSLSLRRLAYSAMALALCLVLPFLTGQIPQIGQMHLPVLLCGFLCSWQWGLAVGFLAPLLRSALFHMPVFYPMALCMAFEMAAYGALCGWLYRRLPRRKSSLYLALIGAMIGGRLVWGLAEILLLGLAAIFLFSGLHVFPTAKNNRKAIEKDWRDSIAAMEKVIPEDGSDHI